MEEFKEKARVLTCKECKYPAKSADPWPGEWTTPTGCAKNVWKPKSCLYFYVTHSLSDYNVSLWVFPDPDSPAHSNLGGLGLILMMHSTAGHKLGTETAFQNDSSGSKGCVWNRNRDGSKQAGEGKGVLPAQEDGQCWHSNL